MYTTYVLYIHTKRYIPTNRESKTERQMRSLWNVSLKCDRRRTMMEAQLKSSPHTPTKTERIPSKIVLQRCGVPGIRMQPVRLAAPAAAAADDEDDEILPPSSKPSLSPNAISMSIMLTSSWL